MNKIRRLALLGSSLVMLAGPVSAEPLKIAMIESLSGPTAVTALGFFNGWRYGIAKLNEQGGFNGAKIEVLEYDNQGGPAGASDKLKLAISEGAVVIASATSSAITAQLAEDVRKYNLRNPGKELIYLNLGSDSKQLLGPRCHFWFFKVGTNVVKKYKMLINAMKRNDLLGSRVYVINQNYSFGKEAQEAQAEFAKEAGAEVVGTALHDMNKIQDFSPYIAQIKASGADTVLTANWGTDIVLLLRAAADAGLKVRFATNSIDTPGTLSSAGKAALGSTMVKPWNLEAGGESGAAFNEDFKKLIGAYPATDEATSAYGILVLGEALRQVDFKGGPIRTKDIALAFEKATWKSPLGTLRVRAEDHEITIPVTASLVSEDAKFKHDGTNMGFKLLAALSPEEAELPPDPACKIERPQ